MEVKDPKKLAMFLFRVIKKNRQNYIGKWKTIGIYQEFMWMWLSLIFFIKGYGLKEKPGLEKLVDSLEGETDKYVNDSTLPLIRDLSGCKIKNEHPPKKQDKSKEADDLETALEGDDKKEILLRTLLLLYVVRCNLFHGDKAWTSQRDNEVMGCATPILRIIVSKLVE